MCVEIIQVVSALDCINLIFATWRAASGVDLSAAGSIGIHSGCMEKARCFWYVTHLDCFTVFMSIPGNRFILPFDLGRCRAVLSIGTTRDIQDPRGQPSHDDQFCKIKTKETEEILAGWVPGVRFFIIGTI